MNKSSTAKQCKPRTKPLTYKDLGLIKQLKIVEESKGEVDDTAGILKEKDSNINITNNKSHWKNRYIHEYFSKVTFKKIILWKLIKHEGMLHCALTHFWQNHGF